MFLMLGEKGVIRTRLGDGMQSRSDRVEGATTLFLNFVSAPNCAWAEWLPGGMCVCAEGGGGYLIFVFESFRSRGEFAAGYHNVVCTHKGTGTFG